MSERGGRWSGVAVELADDFLSDRCWLLLVVRSFVRSFAAVGLKQSVDSQAVGGWQVGVGRLQVAGCSKGVIALSTQVEYEPLVVAGCRLQVAGCRLQVAGCRLQVAWWW